MSRRVLYQWRIPGILVILLLWSMVAVSAESVPDLTGSWQGVSVDTYSPSEGFTDKTNNMGSFHIITKDDLAFAGNVTYFDSDTAANVTHFFPGVLSPDGKTFFKDETGSGISFGELVSDQELYNYMLFADQDLMVIVSHLVKDGTTPAPEKTVPSLIGVWNFTHNRSTGVNTTGLLTIEEQQGRIWSGREQIHDDDGTMIELPMVGTIGNTGRLYGISQDGAFMFGSMIGDEAIENAFVIPGDTDGTLVVERWMTRNETPIPKPGRTYPDITGEWTIDDRKVIQNGTITDEGPVSGEWMSYSNQTERFVTATRHTGDTDNSQDKPSSLIFRTPDEAYLTNADAALVLYHIIDNSTMEAVVNRKDGKSILYLDVLKRKTE
ncbi:MAG: hypothetical protein LUQ50_06405 [Methanospirillum sp.]|uniref:hypothetical protein n=1 Tax=Methanospirillum sp. TaxID=45200 RepID=UPI0023713DE2|nr:hypothetical protein [Methanospirillum sp.]MDD1728685.1 hypothetical protein [Methanospirillum sp.]